jgi:hypothetical protein
MNSMAFLLLVNSSAEIGENQEMELTIGSFKHLHRAIEFISPFRSDETRSIGK